MESAPLRPGHIVTFNAGSSSIKFAIYAMAAQPEPAFRGQIESIDLAPRLKIQDAANRLVADRQWARGTLDHAAAATVLLEAAADLIRGAPIAGVGHRVVHGGTSFAAPVRIDAAVLQTLEQLVPLAPLHQPHNLALIRAISASAPDLAQVACFDTSFHRTQPECAQLFALPPSFAEKGVRRYGFHGLSYEYVTQNLRARAPRLAAGRAIIAHLGNGASLCAVQAGKSLASTMGFTALDGLVMGTRCGAIDPGVLLYLMSECHMDAQRIEHLLYHESGLLGVSGISSDMRELRAAPAPSAKRAIALFTYRILREIGSMAAALGGIDGLVFTAGIGEHDADLRSAVCGSLFWLGLVLDEARNRRGEGRISADHSAVEAWVIPTDEEAMIAAHTAALIGMTAEPRA